MALSLSATLLSLTSFFFSSARPWGQIYLDFQLFYFQICIRFQFVATFLHFIQSFKFNVK